MITIDKSVYLAKGSIVTGDVTIGRDCGVWYNAVIRGDEAPIFIGDRSNVQDNAVVHVDESQPVTIGSGVTIGHGAIVHSCSIGDDTLIGMGAIILNGAMIGKNCIIGAGALVTQGTEIPDNSVAFGNPAKVKHSITDEALAASKKNAEVYVALAKKALQKPEA
ncbi:MAG: gamma carbonic anhydrase family protein [Lachnospiraceae bacterium]|jgi:carbonic anhydrase/acetyltransferase-like protein (isoleucine patch superfamily)|nr:gamma carbonic anhydrase family protein [Lachnospiraceae bacterium]MCI1727607.1 gamma carbonic anhydrase family protein [Lachnospiraceae bacterium]